MYLSTNRSFRTSGGGVKGLLFAMCIWILGLGVLWGSGGIARANDLPYYLYDRGEGIPTSLFGTYVQKGELLFYPFYEFSYNSHEEYKPDEIGFRGKKEFKGKSREHEAILFLSYGLTDWLSVELEGELFTHKTLETAKNDRSGSPNQLQESGIGDVETQVRWRWLKEQENRPELFSFFETSYPTQRGNNVLVGSSDWELALGGGLIRGFRWGTLTARVSGAYDGEENKLEFGEYALEYLKRVSPTWRLVASLEGEDDEVSAIGEVQWFLAKNIFFKFNSGFGLTQKAANVSPEVGVMFVF